MFTQSACVRITSWECLPSVTINEKEWRTTLGSTLNGPAQIPVQSSTKNAVARTGLSRQSSKFLRRPDCHNSSHQDERASRGVGLFRVADAVSIAAVWLWWETFPRLLRYNRPECRQSHPSVKANLFRPACCCEITCIQTLLLFGCPVPFCTEHLRVIKDHGASRTGWEKVVRGPLPGHVHWLSRHTGLGY
jgi:hypothetical protein